MNRKLKFIIFSGIITSVFIGSSAFLAFKLVCSSNGELKPKENVQSKIKTFKSKKENKINVEVKKETKM